MTLGLHSLGAFIWAATLVILVPGPATLLVAGHAQRGAWGAARVTAGVVAGDLMLITLSGLGFSALMQRWPVLGLGLTVAGALYVAWLGWGLWCARPDATRTDDAASPMTHGGFAQGLVLTLTNPKPILFFGAFFPLFIDRSHNGAGHWMASFYALGAVFEAINLIYFATLIGLVARLRRLPALARVSRGQLHRFSGGGLMLCAALMLATALRTA